MFAGYGEFEYPLFLHGRDVDGLSAVAWLPFCCDSLGLDHPPIPESRVLFLQLLDVFGVEDEKQAGVEMLRRLTSMVNADSGTIAASSNSAPASVSP